MPSAQPLLFPDPQPLVERLGREFFRQLPQHPGVYLMLDPSGIVLYVGKAKNLRKRLGSYRVANPDRMPRRYLRLLRHVARIELQQCPDEASALAVEAQLLQKLRPKFNRAGTWNPPQRHLGWRRDGQEIRLAVAPQFDSEWHIHPTVRGAAVMLRVALARLLWVAIHFPRGFAELPIGWSEGDLDAEAVINCGAKAEQVFNELDRFASGNVTGFCEWVRSQLCRDLAPFDMHWLAADCELITELATRARRTRDRVPAF